jgi:UDP-N-acetylglucosamine 2-epimerase (non-hydrolysing)/GDP/UDP-N,N'-diacetylbacillosamine 2-epimerase (hydrolysing)
MGEDPASVHVVGAPGLDNAFRTDLADRAALEAWLGVPLVPPVVVVTVHPVTLDTDPGAAARAVARAMDAVPATWIVTLPNVDPGADEVTSVLTAAASRPGLVAVGALGERRYWGRCGWRTRWWQQPSSLIGAPAVRLPVVNVRIGRPAAPRRNVVDVPADPAVADALQRVLAPGVRRDGARPGGHRRQPGRRTVAISSRSDRPRASRRSGWCREPRDPRRPGDRRARAGRDRRRPRRRIVGHRRLHRPRRRGVRRQPGHGPG